jgi:hypothetical protein
LRRMRVFCRTGKFLPTLRQASADATDVTASPARVL